MRVRLISGISHRFPWLSQSEGQVAHVLLTRSPLIRPASWPSPFDLHVLSTPPAFVLSQNQTLRKCLHGTPPPKGSEATDTRNGPDKDRSDSAEFWPRHPTEVETTEPISTKTHHPATPPPKRAKTPPESEPYG